MSTPCIVLSSLYFDGATSGSMSNYAMSVIQSESKLHLVRVYFLAAFYLLFIWFSTHSCSLLLSRVFSNSPREAFSIEYKTLSKTYSTYLSVDGICLYYAL